MEELHISETEINHLILMVTNYGVSEVLECLKQISDGMLETQRTVVAVNHVTGSDNRLRMWDEISKALSPVVTKVDRIERRYKGMEASRKFMMDAIASVASHMEK